MNVAVAGPAAAPPAGSIRWYAWLYTPLPSRPLAAALFSLESELRASVDAIVDHGVSHLKLQWWKDEIHRLECGEPRHPLTQSLCQARPHAAHAWRPLHDAIAGLELELASASFESERELEGYLVRAGGFCRTLALALDPARELGPLERLGGALGQSIRMVEVIRDLRQDAVMGRIYLPLDWLGECGISHVELRSVDGGDGARRCLARIAERSRIAWATASAELAQVADANLRGLRVLGALHAALLESMARQQYAVGRRRMGLGPLDTLWTAWRSARQH